MSISQAGVITTVRAHSQRPRQVGLEYPAYTWLGFHRATGDVSGGGITVTFTPQKALNDEFVWSLEGACLTVDTSSAANSDLRVQVNINDVARNKFEAGVSMVWSHIENAEAHAATAIFGTSLTNQRCRACPVWVPDDGSSTAVIMESGGNVNGALHRFLCWGFLWERNPIVGRGFFPVRP